MREEEILERAFAMPLTSPSYPRGPYRFVNREYLIITYRTDPVKLRAVVPGPLDVDSHEALVKYEFIRMPDSNGFGDYTESGQVIPVSFRGRKGSYTHSMFLNDEGPIAGGRELWGFPKKLAQPTLRTEVDTLVGTLDYGPIRVATGTMAINIAKPICRKSELRLRRRTSCSRSFRMSTARHASANWSNIISRMSRPRARGPGLRRSS
jgi:acetoacetate decarboxylase